VRLSLTLARLAPCAAIPHRGTQPEGEGKAVAGFL